MTDAPKPNNLKPDAPRSEAKPDAPKLDPARSDASRKDAHTQPIHTPSHTQTPDKANQNIQDTFLNAARKERLYVTIFLMGGAKLSGKIRSFDKYSVILEANHQEQLIFKHAISTVVLSRPSQQSSASAEG